MKRTRTGARASVWSYDAVPEEMTDMPEEVGNLNMETMDVAASWYRIAGEILWMSDLISEFSLNRSINSSIIV